jgi:hypothetical protein
MLLTIGKDVNLFQLLEENDANPNYYWLERHGEP